MLKLERMALRGFKSFGDRTEVKFRPGITAVVGPNGCGKSNIGDALNWVLGEQSAKMLRGRQMADVIFAGSDARKPLGMAEVTLEFGGADGLAGAESGRVSITRRLFRSGESEYLLNGARSRLKDIQEMLREGHVGARTYATIEQGKIDQVLNAKPKDRRGLIEDAAGISGYKHKRRLAELKLEATYANLLRVNDIITEVQRQIGSLKRQASKARRYRVLREELREKELVRFCRQARHLQERLAGAETALAAARDAEAGAAASLGKLESALVEERETLASAERTLRETSEEIHRSDIEVDRMESRIAGNRARIEDATSRIERLREEIAGLERREEGAKVRVDEVRGKVDQGAERLAELTGSLQSEQATYARLETERSELAAAIEASRREQFESMSRAAELRNALKRTEEGLERDLERLRRLEAEQAEASEAYRRNRSEADDLAEQTDRLRDEVGEKRRRQAECERTLEEARQAQDRGTEALARARERHRSAQAMLETLEAIENRFAGVSDGVRALLGEGRERGIRSRGVVADYLEAAQDVESAAEGYLRTLLPAVIVEDDDDARRASEFLRGDGGGRTVLLSPDRPAGGVACGSSASGAAEIPAEILSDPRVVGRLRDHLTVKPNLNGLLSERIGDCLLVRDLAAALELHRRYPRVDYLGLDGDVVYASGLVAVGGARPGDSGLLAHTRKIEETRRELAAAQEEVVERQGDVDRGRERVVALELEARETKEALEQAERRGVELQLRAQRSSEETQRSERRSSVLADELAQVTREIESSRGQREVQVAEREQAEQAHREAEHRLEQESGRLTDLEARWKEQGEKAAELRAERAAYEQQQEAVRAEADRLGEELDELAVRLKGLRLERETTTVALEESRGVIDRTEKELVAGLEARKALQVRAGEMEREIETFRAGVGERDRLLRDQRGGLEQVRETTREAEVARTRAEAERAHLDDLCRQELGMSASEAEAVVETKVREAEQEGLAGPDLSVDLSALEEDVTEIKAKIERIGPVNMTAIEEFGELEERHTFLASQKEDLEQSMESLRETIRRMNRQSRQKFTEAFEAIRASYQEVYKSLFRGGRADLRLEENEDVLEAGIEILAQPPGKRLTGVHLLSGGEKALSAIALLFAIFRYQPSPFCLLDEVDAPLDDHNVVRFSRMLDEYAKNTQFVIITHNKLSMESADVLYGVTMEEPGVSKVVSLELA